MAELSVPRLDFAALGELPQIYQRGQNEAIKKQTLADLGRGVIDQNTATQRLLAVDPQLGMSLSSLGRDQRDYAFRETQAARAQENAMRGFGLQERQINATAANTAAQQALARQQFEYQKEQGDRPEIRDVNGTLMLVDRKTNRLTPINGMPPPPANIPPGVDPATYRKEQAQAAVKSEVADRDLREGGQSVMGMIDQLERKISNPVDPKVSQKFGAATGPFVGPASDASAWDPRKWLYEAGRTRESKAYLDQIKQDAQAINSSVQRALLKGQGAVSDSERASIAQILGAITQARSPEDAVALLGNFKGIVRKMFKIPDGQSQQAAAPSQANGLPPLPPGFVVQQ